MPLSGRYDFKGLKKYGAQGLIIALGTTAWGAAILKVPILGTLLRGCSEFFANWLANKGLMVLNLGAIFVSGEFDQKSFDAAMDKALSEVSQSGGKLTDEQKKRIDDEVIAAFRRFARFT